MSFFKILFSKRNVIVLGHDSSISIVYPGGPVIHRIRMDSLPVVTLVWTSEDMIVAAGHDCRPRVFSGTMNGWEETGTLDDGSGTKTAESRVGRLKGGAFATFRDADSRGQKGGTDTKMTSLHQNTITCVRAYGEGRVSTSGVDGMLIVWKVDRVYH